MLRTMPAGGFPFPMSVYEWRGGSVTKSQGWGVFILSGSYRRPLPNGSLRFAGAGEKEAR